MGQFANTLFSLLMGWVQTAASWLWGLMTHGDVNMWLRWLLDHWLLLAVLLCIGGAVLDFIVYLIRWQPYRVWRSSLHRLTAKDDSEPKEANQPIQQRKWIYADGSTTVEQVPPPIQDAPADEERLETPIRPVRRLGRRSTLEQAYNRPVYPPQWRHTAQKQGENE